MSINKIKLNYLYLLFFILNLFTNYFYLNFYQFNVTNIYKLNLFNSLFLWSPYYICIDNFSLIMIILTILLVITCIITSWKNIKILKKEYYLLLNITLTILIFIFISNEILIFYFFFELILIPIFILIIVWGSRIEKFKSSYYLFFYTFIGSLCMFWSLFFLISTIGSTSINLLYIIELEKQNLLFLCFCLSFMIKIPMVPFHIWLPQAHVEAPLSGSILLAGILLKLGGYGFIKFNLTFLIEGLNKFLSLLITLSIIGIIYGSLLTIRQIDLKRLIAYSSIAHMGFVTIGIFSLTYWGWIGSISLMLAHGLISSALFIISGFLYERFHYRVIKIYKGLLSIMPLSCLLFFFLILANISFPGSINFISEIIIFISLLNSKFNILIIIVIFLSLILSIIYSFNLFNKIYLSSISNYIYFIRDLNKLEITILIIFIILSYLLGFYSFLILSKLHININLFILLIN